MTADDTLLVTRLDRLARSTRDLLNILDAVAKAGAGFRSLADIWADTTTLHGRLMLTVLGGLAEVERDLIRTRTGEGRARAKTRGVHMGRSPKLTAHQKREALNALADGTASQADLAARWVSERPRSLARPCPRALRETAGKVLDSALGCRIGEQSPIRHPITRRASLVQYKIAIPTESPRSARRLRLCAVLRCHSGRAIL
jgi:hypothetical protein